MFDFKLKDGNKEKFSLRGILGASEVGLSANGPIGDKTTYQVSLRRSYLQFLFDMIGLPFLPTFTDAQFKVKHSFDRQNELTILGLGAIDDMKLNTGDEESLSEENQYILSYLPVIQQKSYTLGAVYKHYAGNNNYNVIISRSQTNNKNTKYRDNDESSADNLTLRYNSDEIENKLRSENTIRLPFVQLNFGGNVDYAQYRNNTYQKIFTTNPYTILYDTDLGLWKWGLYATAIYESYDERFTASLGLRADANNYAPTGATEWSFMTEAAYAFGFYAEMVAPTRQTVESALRQGNPVICVVGAGDFTMLGHYIILKSIDERGMVEIYDPNSPDTSARKWDLVRVLNQADVAWVYSAA